MKKLLGLINDKNALKQTRNSVEDIWGERTPHKGEWPIRKDERILEEPDEWVQSDIKE